MKLCSVWSSHDASFYVSNDGYPVMHCEYERFIREKESIVESIDDAINCFLKTDIDALYVPDTNCMVLK